MFFGPNAASPPKNTSARDRRHRRPCRRPACPIRRTRCRCRARSTERRSPGRPRPARRRTRMWTSGSPVGTSLRRPLASYLRRDLLEHHAGELAVVVGEFLRHEVVEDRDALVHRVFLLPGRRLHLVEAGAHDDLDVLAAEAPRRCGSSPSRCCRRRARSRACRSWSMWPKETLDEPVDADVDVGGGLLAPGNVEVAAARRAGADEDRVVVLRRAAPSCCRCAGRRGTRRRGRGCSRPPRRSPPRAGGTCGIWVRIMPPACGSPSKITHS